MYANNKNKMKYSVAKNENEITINEPAPPLLPCSKQDLNIQLLAMYVHKEVEIVLDESD